VIFWLNFPSGDCCRLSAPSWKSIKKDFFIKNMEGYLAEGEKILRKAANLLGADDKVYEMIDKLINLCAEDVSNIQAIVEKGKCVENYSN